MSIWDIEITTADDTIDTRHVIERIAHLEDLVFENEADDDEITELAKLHALAHECEWVDDWAYGATLVRDDYFTDYARDFAEGCGFEIPTSDEWPYAHVTIDWDAAAEALQSDYTSVTFDGVTYWVR